MKSAMDATMERARSTMAGFTIGQRTMLVLATVALILGAVALTSWITKPTMSPLFGNLTGADASAIVDELTSTGVSYELANGGTTIMVPADQVYNLRVSLSGKGLPTSNGTEGYSLLEKQGITATDFQQNVAYRRALEGELSKTLQAITGVKTAVVHLALPKKDVFATEQDKATASVLLALNPGTELDKGQVRSITHLVAGSVEGLEPGSVTVSDGNGKLLSTKAEGAEGAASAASEADQQTAMYEERLSDKVQQMLDKVVGPGRSVVRLNADLDFSNRDTTSERYVTETGVPPLSEATIQERMNGAGAAAGGTLGQTFPSLAPIGGAGAGSQYGRDQKTVNNAVGKIVDRTTGGAGTVKRMTVAVVLDAKTAGTVDPNMVQQLVANAVGLDTVRGDSVQVDKIPFDTTATTAAAKELEAAESAAKMSGYVNTGKQFGLGLLVLIIAFLLLRRGKRDPEIEALVNDLPEEEDGIKVLTPSPLDALEMDPNLLALEASSEERDKRDQLRDEVAELVDNAPDEVAVMLQSWLAEQS